MRKAPSSRPAPAAPPPTSRRLPAGPPTTHARRSSLRSVRRRLHCCLGNGGGRKATALFPRAFPAHGVRRSVRAGGDLRTRLDRLGPKLPMEEVGDGGAGDPARAQQPTERRLNRSALQAPWRGICSFLPGRGARIAPPSKGPRAPRSLPHPKPAPHPS